MTKTTTATTIESLPSKTALDNKAASHYIDGKAFTQEIREYVDACNDSEEKGEAIPKVTDSIALQFQLIATRMSFRPQFRNYSWRDDMIMDGTIACLKCVRNFDYSLGFQAFSYFSRVIWFAFIQRINTENKQRKVKESIVTNYYFESSKDNNESSILYNEAARGLANALENDVLSTYFFKKATTTTIDEKTS